MFLEITEYLKRITKTAVNFKVLYSRIMVV
jgi:hypothetical protein